MFHQCNFANQFENRYFVPKQQTAAFEVFYSLKSTRYFNTKCAICFFRYERVNSVKLERAVIFMKHIPTVISLIFLQKILVKNGVT